jgi:hypothetical protein
MISEELERMKLEVEHEKAEIQVRETGLQIEGIFYTENDHLIMQEYDSKCLKMYLITLKVFTIC